MNKILIIILLIGILFVLPIESHGSNWTIDVLPQGFMGDATTPFAIHFTMVTSAFSGYSAISAKIRMQSGTSNANNQTWSFVYPAGWRNDNAGFSTLQPITISGTTASGWLFGRSTSRNYFGASTCSIRARRGGSVTNYDLTEPVTIYSWNSSSQAGWLDGIYPGGGNIIVLAMDSVDMILGSYITEPNGINEGYPNTTGYFKLAVPVGTVTRLEYRNLDNQIIGSQSGPWTITANTVTNLPEPATAPIFIFWDY